MDSFRYILYVYKRTLLRANDDGKRMENPSRKHSEEGNFTAGKTGGEKTHVLTVDEMPKHRHRVGKFATMQGGGTWDCDKIGGAQLRDSKVADGYTDYAGTSKAHNNMPPYIAVYLWRRTA